MGHNSEDDYVQKVTISIKTPSQTIKIDLDVPEMEIEDLIMAIDAQCENYIINDDDDCDEDEDDFYPDDSDDL